MIKYVIDNKEFFGILVSFFAIIIPLTTLIYTKRKEQEQNNFEKFHKVLIAGLSNQSTKIGLDEQVAILYELREYPKYYPVIKRILKFQINRWNSQLLKNPHYRLLITEADLTLRYTDCNRFKVVWNSLKNTLFVD